MRTPLALTTAAALALAGCAAEITAGIDEGGFGRAVAANAAVMAGRISYAQALGERFAREVPDTVTFDFDSATLDAEAQAALRRQADWIRQFPEVRFRVYGHTDLVGSDGYNRALGRRRAEAVVAFLAAQGISRSRLEAVVSYGRTRPAIRTSDPERRNRRTVTEVTGFVGTDPAVLDGKYADVIYRQYVRSGVRSHGTVGPAGGE